MFNMDGNMYSEWINMDMKEEDKNLLNSHTLMQHIKICFNQDLEACLWYKKKMQSVETCNNYL